MSYKGIAVAKATNENLIEEVRMVDAKDLSGNPIDVVKAYLPDPDDPDDPPKDCTSDKELVCPYTWSIAKTDETTGETVTEGPYFGWKGGTMYPEVDEDTSVSVCICEGTTQAPLCPFGTPKGCRCEGGKANDAIGEFCSNDPTKEIVSLNFIDPTEEQKAYLGQHCTQSCAKNETGARNWKQNILCPKGPIYTKKFPDGLDLYPQSIVKDGVTKLNGAYPDDCDDACANSCKKCNPVTGGMYDHSPAGNQPGDFVLWGNLVRKGYCKRSEGCTPELEGLFSDYSNATYEYAPGVGNKKACDTLPVNSPPIGVRSCNSDKDCKAEKWHEMGYTNQGAFNYNECANTYAPGIYNFCTHKNHVERYGGTRNP